MFDDNGVPLHVERINTECANMFASIRQNPDRMAHMFGIPYRQIDLKLAWRIFDVLAYDVMFKETGGDFEALYDPMTRSRVLTSVMQRWPLLYYLELLSERGVMRTVEHQGTTTFFVAERYKPLIKTSLMASETSPRKYGSSNMDE